MIGGLCRSSSVIHHFPNDLLASESAVPIKCHKANPGKDGNQIYSNEIHKPINMTFTPIYGKNASETLFYIVQSVILSVGIKGPYSRCSSADDPRLTFDLTAKR